MLQLTGIPNPGYASSLIELVWPKLEKALRTGRPHDSRAGLFLLLSTKVTPDDLADICQLATAKPEPLVKPILVTPAALGLTDPASAETATDAREPTE